MNYMLLKPDSDIQKTVKAQKQNYGHVIHIDISGHIMVYNLNTNPLMKVIEYFRDKVTNKSPNMELVGTMDQLKRERENSVIIEKTSNAMNNTFIFCSLL